MVIELEHLERLYAPGVGVRDVSLHVPAASIYVLAGPTGSGKTTTLSVVAGLRFTRKGNLCLDGRNIPLHRSCVRPGLGFLADTPVLDARLTPVQWLRFARGMKAAALTTDASSLASTLLLDEEALYRPIRTLSFGTQRKVVLWTELLTTDRCLIMDEPFIGLDPAAIQGAEAALREYVADGRAVVVSTHLLHEAQSLATHVGVIAKGRTLWDGPVAGLTGESTLRDAFLALTADSGG